MATNSGVWGIDIGQSALKALRCTVDGDGKLVADAFDFIEYPKILSQPEADPESLVRDALQQFLSRNELKGDRVAISVAGQNGLARFFKPPPVDAKKIPDIVKYEARQQIPFALEDVIWDYQRMGGGAEVDGIALEAEVGLFAMKRDQVFRSISPFDKAGIELDCIQLAPLSIYNFVSHCLITDGPAPEDYDPDNPPNSQVVLSVGTDTTDLVVTNGFRVWQRNIPIGGNHFTRQLTKDLKLTFAKAEHLKRNARQAEDAKAVFQSMRPIFNDLLTEVQRSIQYFQSIDRNAHINGIVMLGNAMKLPGLQQYLAKNLGYSVVEVNVNTWKSTVSGPTVLSSPSFKDNVLAFGVCYGLCLQGLGKASLSTNLLPREILTQRLIRQKKPWAVASVAILLAACMLNYIFYYNVWSKVRDEYQTDGASWKSAVQSVENARMSSQSAQNDHNQRIETLAFLDAVGDEVAGNADRRRLWLEVLDAIAEALPISDGLQRGEVPDPTQIPYHKQKELHIVRIESKYFEQIEQWFTPEVKSQYERGLDPKANKTTEAQPSDDGSQPPEADPTATDSFASESTEQTGPTGPGWVVEISGYHFYYDADSMSTTGTAHVRNSFMRSLSEGTVTVLGPDMKPMQFTTEELGIEYVTLVDDGGIDREHMMPNPNYQKSEAGSSSSSTQQERIRVPRNVFTVQFCWREKPLTMRLKEREEKRKQQADQMAQSTAAVTTSDTGAAGGN